ncbi:MAG TPA: FHA domain-containing protein [Steroidobacteraceae bacterium]
MKLIFGDCILDLSERQLWRGGEVVPLEPKMYQLLAILIKRRPAVIANEELDELLWPHVYVARTSLTRLVSALRSVLGDESRDSRIIRTAYKTGYAFCANVTDSVPGGNPTARPEAIQLVWNERIIPLSVGEFVAGRGEECAVVIDASTVSRRHAKIVVATDQITVEDLESTNGTRVNGVQITAPTVIANGGKIELGSEVLQIRKRSPSVLTVRMDSRRPPPRGIAS